jgi:hypothetical protein
MANKGLTGGQVNEYPDWASVEIEQGLNPINNDFLKAIEGADSWPAGIKKDGDDRNGVLTSSNPAWPNKKSGN